MRYLTFTPSTIDVFNACRREYALAQFADLLIPNIEPGGLSLALGDPKLDRGDFMHRIMEFYYKSSRDVELAIKMVHAYMAESNVSVEEAEESIKVFRKYAEYYKHCDWEILKVEEPFNRVIWEGKDLTIILSGKKDLVIREPSTNLKFPVDHKTMRKRYVHPSTGNQIKAYCWDEETDHIWINKIGYQTTLPPEKQFERQFIEVQPDIINEWKEVTIYLAMELDQAIIQGIFPPSFNACDSRRFGRCRYYDLCKAPPNLREWKAKSLYRIVPPHDPGGEVEEESA